MAIVGEAKEMMKDFERQACEERGRGREKPQWAGLGGKRERWLGREAGGRTGITLTTMASHLGLRDCSLLFPFAPAENIIPSHISVILKDAQRCVSGLIDTLT